MKEEQNNVIEKLLKERENEEMERKNTRKNIAVFGLPIKQK